MAISAPPGKGRGRESVRACVRERGRGRDGVRSRGGRGRGRGSARVCGSEQEAECAAGSPRLSRQRGVARHGQKVSSAPRASEVAGSRRAMPGWEGTEPPSRERFQEISVWRCVFPGCKARGGGVLLAAVGRQAARNSPLATAAGGRGAPARALLPPHRPPAGRAPRRRRPRGTPRALRPVLQHHGQRLQHRRQRPAARRTAPRPFSTADSTAPTPRPRRRPPPEQGGPRTGLVGTPLSPRDLG